MQCSGRDSTRGNRDLCSDLWLSLVLFRAVTPSRISDFEPYMCVREETTNITRNILLVIFPQRVGSGRFDVFSLSYRNRSDVDTRDGCFPNPSHVELVPRVNLLTVEDDGSVVCWWFHQRPWLPSSLRFSVRVLQEASQLECVPFVHDDSLIVHH